MAIYNELENSLRYLNLILINEFPEPHYIFVDVEEGSSFSWNVGEDEVEVNIKNNNVRMYVNFKNSKSFGPDCYLYFNLKDIKCHENI
jgi:hypothetical protein